MVFEDSDKKVRDAGDTEFAFQLSFPRSGGCVSYVQLGSVLPSLIDFYAVL